MAQCAEIILRRADRNQGGPLDKMKLAITSQGSRLAEPGRPSLLKAL